MVDFTLPLEMAQVQSLVRELRSHMPRGAAKKKKKEPPIVRAPMWDRHQSRRPQACFDSLVKSGSMRLAQGLT